MHQRTRLRRPSFIPPVLFLACSLTAVLAPAGNPASESVRVTVSPSHVEVDNGRIRFNLSRGPDATIEFVELAGRRRVDENREPLLSARLIESEAYDWIWQPVYLRLVND